MRPARLVVRPAPHPREGLPVYVLRLAEANGYRDPRRVLELAGLSPTYASRPCDLSGLADAVDRRATVPELERLAGWPDATGRISVGRELVSPCLLSRARCRLCVACVEEGGPVEPAWDLAAFAACPIHGTVLTDACACGAGLTWTRPAVLRCRCGRPLEPSEAPAPASSLDVARALGALAAGRVEGFAPIPVASLDAYGRLLRFLGTQGRTPREWRSNLMAQPSVPEAVAALDRAAPALADWPLGWREWLREAGRFDGEAGSRPELTILSRRLRACLSAPGLEDVLDETRRSVMEGPHGPLVKSWAFFHTDDAKPTHVRGGVGARRLGVTVASVVALIADGGIQGRSVPFGRRRAHLVDIGRLDDALALRRSSMNAAGIGAKLKVPSDQVDALRRAGVFGSVGGVPGRRGNGAYPPGAADELLARLAAVASTGPRRDDVPLSACTGRRYAHFADVVASVVDGRLQSRVRRGGPRSLADVFVCRRAISSGPVDETEPTLSVREAASRLGVSVRMIPVLIRAGCLDGGGASRRRSVTIRSVADFPRRYATASVFAGRWRTNTRSAIRRLREMGMIPIVDGDTRAGVSSIWRVGPEASVRPPDRRRPARPASARRSRGVGAAERGGGSPRTRAATA